MDPSVVAAMDKDALKKQIENMKYQATMERWPLSKSIAAWVTANDKSAVLFNSCWSADCSVVEHIYYYGIV